MTAVPFAIDWIERCFPPLGRACASALASVALLGGCGSEGSGASGPILLSDANNYSASASLSIPVLETAAATDLDLCWTDVVSDLQCHPLSSQADVDTVALLRISHLTQPEVEQKLASGLLAQSDIAGYLDFKTDHTSTCAKLSDLTLFGTAVDVPSQYIESSDYTYLLLAAKGTTPGTGARTMTFLQPTSTSTNTKVDAPAGCGLLDFSADLSSLTQVPVPASAPWLLDWSAVTRDGLGNPLQPLKVDGLTIGFFADLSVAEIAAKILDIQLIASSLWDLPLERGTKADLSHATERTTGASFAGFERPTKGSWIFALTCSTCQNPAPLLLTILAPSGGAK